MFRVQGSGFTVQGWMKMVLDESVIGRNLLDESVIGRNHFWMKVSLDEPVFG